MSATDLARQACLASTLTLLSFALPTLAAQDSRPSETESQPAEAEPVKVGLVRFTGSYLDLPEGGADLTAALLGNVGKPKDFYEMLQQLRRAAKKDDFDTVLVDLTRNFSVNSVQLTEIGRVFEEIRDSGKKTIAFLENGSSGLYRLATFCDEIVMADLGALDFAAPSMNVLFMRDALDLLGVRMEIVRCGDFKGAVEPYMNSRMSDHLRDHYLAMLEAMNADTIRHIGRRRGLEIERLRALQKQRLFLAREARDAGLIDTLVPWQGPSAMMAARFDGREVDFVPVLRKAERRTNFNPMTEFFKLFNPREEEEELEEPSVVVLHLQGTIIDGHTASPGSIVSGPVVRQLENLRDNDEVRAVVLRINSPGGSATASEAILLATREVAAKKPVVVSMGTLAASGGYYVTCFGGPIFAEAGTITGSIGVFGTKPNLGPLFRRIGLHEEIVGLDEVAGMNAMAHSWSDEQHERMQTLVDGIYERFIGHVAESRNMTTDAVLAIAGGRVWSGVQAKDAGLVDEIGGLDAAIARAAQAAEIAGGDFEIRHMPKPKDFFEVLAQQMLQARAVLDIDQRLSAMVLGHAALDHAVQLALDAFSERPTRCWAVLPAMLRVGF